MAGGSPLLYVQRYWLSTSNRGGDPRAQAGWRHRLHAAGSIRGVSDDDLCEGCGLPERLCICSEPDLPCLICGAIGCEGECTDDEVEELDFDIGEGD